MIITLIVIASWFVAFDVAKKTDDRLDKLEAYHEQND